MQQQANQLASYLVKKIEFIPKDARIIVGLCGIPASGKSTMAEMIVDRTNALLLSSMYANSTETNAHAENSSTRPKAILIGLDGWHLTRAQLDVMPDPKLAYERRGIHWTFDGDSYVSFVRSLRESIVTTTVITPDSNETDMLNATIITAPSFDHALKDPTPHAVQIRPEHRIVVIEGLYTLLSIPPWREAAEMLDERWYLRLDEKEAKDRLVKRHVRTGVAGDMAEAIKRADENDMPNGRFIIKNMLEPTLVIDSLDDPVLTAAS